MAYPKPLKEKTIEKRFKETGISKEKIDFLHDFTLACTNLYGVITLIELYDVYKRYANINNNTIRIRRSELEKFSTVARRENVPYYVFEIDELFKNERKISERIFLTKNILGFSNSDYRRAYYLIENQNKCVFDFYVPQDLLKYKEFKYSDAYYKLENYLGKLKVTMDYTIGVLGENIVKENKGKYLNEFIFYDNSYKFEKDYYKEKAENGNTYAIRQLKYLEYRYQDVISVKLSKYLYERLSIGMDTVPHEIRNLFEMLKGIGVDVYDRHLKELMYLITAVNNESRLMCMRGHKPKDLLKDELM